MVKTFGHYLRAKRHALGLSQTDLSDKTGIQRTSISRLESATGNPQWSMIQHIAEKGLGIKVAELFEDEPVEARQPVIQVESSNAKLAGMTLKAQGKIIPILATASPLRSKVITDADVSGYCILDRSLIDPYADSQLGIWIQVTNPSMLWCVVSMTDTELRNGTLYLVDAGTGVEIRRVWLTPKGALILEGLNYDDTQPIAFWGRQKDRVEILGRVVMTATPHHAKAVLPK